MSPIALAMDLLLAGLLAVAVVVGLRLNRRLKTLRDGQAGFAAAAIELNQAVGRAEAGLAALRAASEEVHDSLLSRTETARTLSAKLEAIIQRAETAVEAAARATPPTTPTGALPSALASIAAMIQAEPAQPAPRLAPVSPQPRAKPRAAAGAAPASDRPQPAIIRPRRTTVDEDLYEGLPEKPAFDLGPLDTGAAAPARPIQARGDRR